MDLKEAAAYILRGPWESFSGAAANFCQSSESSRKSGRICHRTDVTRSSFPPIFTALLKGPEGSRRPTYIL
jgi:hypothetical protein